MIYVHLSSSSTPFSPFIFPFWRSYARTHHRCPCIYRKEGPFLFLPSQRETLLLAFSLSDSSIPILRLDIVRHRLRLLVSMVRVVWIVRRADIFHLVDAAAFVAALVGAGAGDLSFEIQVSASSSMRGPVYGFRHTTTHLTPWESAGQPVQPHCSSSPADLTMMGSFNVPVLFPLRNRL